MSYAAMFCFEISSWPLYQKPQKLAAIQLETAAHLLMHRRSSRPLSLVSFWLQNFFDSWRTRNLEPSSDTDLCKNPSSTAVPDTLVPAPHTLPWTLPCQCLLCWELMIYQPNIWSTLVMLFFLLFINRLRRKRLKYCAATDVLILRVCNCTSIKCTYMIGVSDGHGVSIEGRLAF